MTFADVATTVVLALAYGVLAIVTMVKADKLPKPWPTVIGVFILATSLILIGLTLKQALGV